MRSDGVLQSFLRGKNPFHETQALWANGTLPLRVRYFLSNDQAPEGFVTSVRCLVQHNESVLVLRNRDGVHAWAIERLRLSWRRHPMMRQTSSCAISPCGPA